MLPNSVSSVTPSHQDISRSRSIIQIVLNIALCRSLQWHDCKQEWERLPCTLFQSKLILSILKLFLQPECKVSQKSLCIYRHTRVSPVRNKDCFLVVYSQHLNFPWWWQTLFRYIQASQNSTSLYVHHMLLQKYREDNVEGQIESEMPSKSSICECEKIAIFATKTFYLLVMERGDKNVQTHRIVHKDLLLQPVFLTLPELFVSIQSLLVHCIVKDHEVIHLCIYWLDQHILQNSYFASSQDCA